MRQGRRIVAGSTILLLSVGLVAHAATITSIDFENVNGKSEIRIKSDGPVTYEKQEDPSTHQIVLEVKGAKLSPNASRKLDTSSFEGQVALVSPYQVEGSDDLSRVVIQLRPNATATLDLVQEGNVIKASIPTGGATASSENPSATPTESAAADLPGTPTAEAATAEAAPSTAPPGTDTLKQFETTQKTKRFTGKKVTMIVRDAELADVFQLFGEASGFNVMISSEVKGKVTLNMIDVPWDQALEMILHTQQLGAERNGNVLRITTLASLTAEKQAELVAQQASEASAPRVTRVFSINYADLGELTGVLSKFGTGGNSTNTSSNTATAIVQADNRTNSIVVRDTLENIERMKKLIEILDTQTPQVLIEAKVVEATEVFSRTIGGTLGVGFNDDTPDNLQTIASFNGGNPLDTFTSTTGAASVFGSGSVSASASSAGRIGASFAFLPGQARLNAVLDLAESNSTIRVVSSPKTVVLNKVPASILQGIPVLVPSTIVSNGVVTSSFNTLQAKVSMSVTPTVTNESSVLLDLEVNRDVPTNLGGGNQAIASRNLKTKVLVDSGSTLVIGGIYTMQQSEAEGGFPWLRKIPILGWFFGSKESSSNRAELFFFITPRILNSREAGLAG